ncbi:hypothetical protein C8R44DRAFT_741944 [Mycena epipterygia]|nr:hypothetical protein C8R44DRAFT_741944 [Mycena epipterygia]
MVERLAYGYSEKCAVREGNGTLWRVAWERVAMDQGCRGVYTSRWALWGFGSSQMETLEAQRFGSEPHWLTQMSVRAINATGFASRGGRLWVLAVFFLRPGIGCGKFALRQWEDSATSIQSVFEPESDPPASRYQVTNREPGNVPGTNGIHWILARISGHTVSQWFPMEVHWWAPSSGISQCRTMPISRVVSACITVRVKTINLVHDMPQWA